MVKNKLTILEKEYLDHLYYSPDSPVAFSGVKRLHNYVRADNKYHIEKDQLEEWLSGEKSYTNFRFVKRKFPRQKVIVSAKNATWQLDCCYMNRFGEQNKGFKYILLCIDILSRFCRTYPLQTLKGDEMVKALKKTMKSVQPQKICSDKGVEFCNKKVRHFLQEKNIIHYTTNNEVKASLAERAIKSIKTRLMKHMYRHNTHSWLDVLSKITTAHNSSYHSSIGMSPKEASTTEDAVLYNYQYFIKKPVILMHKKFKYNIHDRVKITYLKSQFLRAYDQLWSEQIFSISSRVMKQNIPVYTIKSWDNENISGTFYESELQKVSVTDDTLYTIERVLRQRKNKGRVEYLVRWLGYGSEYDTWLGAEDIQTYK